MDVGQSRWLRSTAAIFMGNHGWPEYLSKQLVIENRVTNIKQGTNKPENRARNVATLPSHHASHKRHHVQRGVHGPSHWDHDNWTPHRRYRARWSSCIWTRGNQPTQKSSGAIWPSTAEPSVARETSRLSLIDRINWNLEPSAFAGTAQNAKNNFSNTQIHVYNYLNFNLYSTARWSSDHYETFSTEQSNFQLNKAF